jgi:hypothetical protein
LYSQNIGRRRKVMRKVLLGLLLALFGTQGIQAATAEEEPPQILVQPPHLWSQRFGDWDVQSGLSVAFDNSGNVVITGYFQGTVDFGGGPLISAGGRDIFLAKFDANGTHL